jgi:hypothetical protein
MCTTVPQYRGQSSHGLRRHNRHSAIFGESEFGKYSANIGRAQYQCLKIRYGVEPSYAVWPPSEPMSTCYMWYNAGANRGQITTSQWAMDTTYELLWCIVIDIMRASRVGHDSSEVLKWAYYEGTGRTRGRAKQQIQR